MYDPVSRRIVTQRKATEGGRQEPRQGSSSPDAADTDNEAANRGRERPRWSSQQVDGARQNLGFGGSKKKKGKARVSWVCSDCGHTDGQWWGTCRACHKVGTLKEFVEEENGGGNSKVTGYRASDNAMQSWLPKRVGDDRPMRITDVSRGLNHSEWRIPL